MRSLLVLVPLALLSAPAMAAEPASPVADQFEFPAELTDPAMAETLAKILGSLTRAMMDMPVGEMQAAVEGRQPSAADKGRTVRDMTAGGADIERQVEAQVAQSVPRMQASLKALAESLPGMMKALGKAADDMEARIEGTAANLPQPGYPKQ